MVAGRRVTDDAALEVAKMVYAGTAQHRRFWRRCASTRCRRSG